MESSKIIDGNCWIAYFDILGFSNMVESFPAWFVKELYEQALKETETYNKICKFIFFSDSFLFYTENNSQESLNAISTITAIFFHGMFLKEYPMRGCLNIGKFYADRENGIYFGPGLTKAYHLAEGQNWIGYIFSEEAGEKFESFESNGFRSNIRLRYTKYGVPYKKPPERRHLYAYNLKLSSPSQNPSQRFQTALDDMEYKTSLTFKTINNTTSDVNKCPEYINILDKYKNTREFLFHVYPELNQKKCL